MYIVMLFYGLSLEHPSKRFHLREKRNTFVFVIVLARIVFESECVFEAGKFNEEMKTDQMSWFRTSMRKEYLEDRSSRCDQGRLGGYEYTRV